MKGPSNKKEGFGLFDSVLFSISIVGSFGFYSDLKSQLILLGEKKTPIDERKLSGGCLLSWS